MAHPTFVSSGLHGRVFTGYWGKLQVAAKMSHGPSSEGILKEHAALLKFEGDKRFMQVIRTCSGIVDSQKCVGFVMPYVQFTLAHMFQQSGLFQRKRHSPLVLPVFQKVSSSLLEAIHIMHENQVFHNDIAPPNLFIRLTSGLVLVNLRHAISTQGDFEVVIGDFGMHGRGFTVGHRFVKLSDWYTVPFQTDLQPEERCRVADWFSALMVCISLLIEASGEAKLRIRDTDIPSMRALGAKFCKCTQGFGWMEWLMNHSCEKVGCPLDFQRRVCKPIRVWKTYDVCVNVGQAFWDEIQAVIEPKHQ